MNERGLSLNYYNDCTEYYDLQGYYHKDCNDKDTYLYTDVKKDTKKALDKSIDFLLLRDPKPEKKLPPKPNVW
ncbi:hypothetical protein JHD48_01215 [Sulfurimonas sp. SAG-AH-194-I05]|nr:hypothetical protein [Sulfurimonas sp. SAG-AH-194-I05]MDF1874348.1 hypothetical protein [Sulfurimonas sp. SAG-AH-194-I05]